MLAPAWSMGIVHNGGDAGWQGSGTGTVSGAATRLAPGRTSGQLLSLQRHLAFRRWR